VGQLTKGEVLEKASEYNVKFVRLQFTDILGRFKNIAITVEELERALNGQVKFDGSVIEGYVSNKQLDIYLCPDTSTFVIFPWRPREGAVARLICDVYTPEGDSFDGCSRAVLKRVLEQARSMGYEPQVGANIEFFLFHTDEQGKPTTRTHDQAGYCDLTPADLGENCRRDIVLTLEEMGFDVASSYHETAPGQHGIFLKEDSALVTADRLVTFKFVVRTIAQRHGLYASFMPKPFSSLSGSGLNLYLSLWHGGENAFCLANNTSGLNGLDEIICNFIAGLLLRANGYMAITNPLINSYKRFLPGDVAPSYIAWSYDDRSTMVRVMEQKEDGLRVILQSPDATCNPYLALAAVLSAGLDGIVNKLPLAGPFGTKKNDIPPALPHSLDDALKGLAADLHIKKTLGERIWHRFLTVKEEECMRFKSEVHDWELNNYLANY